MSERRRESPRKKKDREGRKGELEEYTRKGTLVRSRGQIAKKIRSKLKKDEKVFYRFGTV
jgi:hypothetical protein